MRRTTGFLSRTGRMYRSVIGNATSSGLWWMPG